jgi:cytoskeletal protein RodZ
MFRPFDSPCELSTKSCRDSFLPIADTSASVWQLAFARSAPAPPKPVIHSSGLSEPASRALPGQHLNLSSRYWSATYKTKGVNPMTNSASSLMAVIFGLAVFALIVAVGWRSVQNRRILRLQGTNGQETIIVAREDDDITSVVTTVETTQPAPAPAPAIVVVNTGVTDPATSSELGRKVH